MKGNIVTQALLKSAKLNKVSMTRCRDLILLLPGFRFSKRQIGSAEYSTTSILLIFSLLKCSAQTIVLKCSEFYINMKEAQHSADISRSPTTGKFTKTYGISKSDHIFIQSSHQCDINVSGTKRKMSSDTRITDFIIFVQNNWKHIQDICASHQL